MKKLFSVTAACYSILLFSGCGTFNSALTHGKSTVSLMRAPKDIVVKVNGVKQDITKEMFAATTSIGGTRTTTYYASAIKLPSKRKVSIELYSPSMNKQATVKLRPKASKNIIWADILLTACVGLWIDIPTGNLKFLTPRLIDVESALEGKDRKDWLSQGKLKRMGKRSAKKN
jgi:hypothetical protein